MPKIILIVAAIVIAALAGAYFLIGTPEGASHEEGVAESENEGEELVLPTPNPGYTIEQVPILDSSSLPDLDRAIHFSASIPEEARVALSAKASLLAERLKQDPSQGGDWLELALVFHQANDYAGAEEIWKFLTVALPDDTTAYDNLGKLYHFSLRDYPKAEEYFKKSIAVNPGLTTPYLELFELYRYSYKTETSAAVEIMGKAIALDSSNADFYTLLGAYYRDRGRTAEARTAYEKAMDLARAAGNLPFMAAIGDELKQLP